MAVQNDPKLLQKQACAKAVLPYIDDNIILGVGTGSTVNCLIEILAQTKIKGAVVSSQASQKRLEAIGIEIFDLNQVGRLDLYIDGADEISTQGVMIKGGGGALTREKIVAAASDRFICLADDSKWVDNLGRFPVAIEVLSQARSYVARQLVQIGGTPVYREGFVTDYGNVILDTFDLFDTAFFKDILKGDILALESHLNNIVGVVCHGIFAVQSANLLLKAGENGVQLIEF